jgi:hypothetical protein
VNLINSNVTSEEVVVLIVSVWFLNDVNQQLV